MKTIIATIALGITSLISFAQEITETITETSVTTITVNVPIPSEDGSVLFSLQTKDNWLTGGVENLEGQIADGKATVTFENVVSGDYAITLFWDKNGNKKMDFEPSGRPKEMYGVSNNVINMGPPQWSDAVFTVAGEPRVLDIRM
ncbi:MAG: hypothetical protein ACI825_000734 [Planctomycetota bacterium]|jgi:uncharacterized protein (DUF2141 family)|uniref:DUF2141 domain-containing protein n=1 Tax=Patiriisocius sp. Uisw_047 TaxID=3230969 RepID=UPI0039E90798